MRKAIALRCAQPYPAGVPVKYPKVAMSAIAAMTDPAAASAAGRLRGRHGPHTSSAVPVRARHTAVLPPASRVRYAAR